MSAILIEDLTFSHAGAHSEAPVFSGLDLRLHRGHVTCLVGPSGCGKSTMLNLIAGFLHPSRGSIRFEACEAEGRVGYIFQQDALLPWRSVRGNLRLPAELQGRPAAGDDARVCQLLGVFGFDESVLDKSPNQLSGGMRQRISIIQALLANPQILLLDEPFAALDFFTRIRLESDFRALVESRGLTAVFVTHDIDEAIALGDRVIVLGSAPRGIVADITIAPDGPSRPDPEAMRGHEQFGRYFSAVWESLRDAV